MRMDIPALEEFGQNTTDDTTDDLLHQTRGLIIDVNTSSADHFEDSDLGTLRA